MANKNVGIHVTGVAEFTAALRAMDKELYKQFRLGMKEIARHAIRVAEGRGAPVGALKPRATTKGAGIALPKGGPESASDAMGHYPWLDFGGAPKLGRGVTSSSRIAHKKATGGFRRALVEDGRYVYPAIAESRDFIGSELGYLIEKVAKGKGFEVRG